MPTQININLVLCTTPPVCPVVDERGCNRYFGSWRNSVHKGHIPFAVNALTLQNGLDFNVSIYSPGAPPVECARNKWAHENRRKDSTPEEIEQLRAPGAVLKFLAQDKNKNWVQVGVTAEFEGDPIGTSDGHWWFTFKGVDLKSLASSRASGQPWAYTGSFLFELSIISTPGGDPIDTRGYSKWVYDRFPQNGVPIEMYAICPALPKFLRYEGIPSTLLRFALGSYNTQVGDDSNTSYLEAITNRVFNSGFVYERNDGSFAFTPGAGQPFELGKYLQIWDVLNGTASEEKTRLFAMRGYLGDNPPTVNCYDQTGILGICMSFACKDEYDRDSLIAYYMEPFGFLHAIPLVGFQKDKQGNPQQCNNPFDSWQKDLFINQPDSPNRTKFGNHVFLMFRERIYDACAGPFIGVKLQGYISSGIDSKAGTYPPRFKVGDKDDPDLQEYVESAITGKWDNAKPYRPSDSHEGILGEVGHMLHRGKWSHVPDDLNDTLNEAAFDFDIQGLGDWLIQKTKGLKQCEVTKISPPLIYTGAGDINRPSDDLGEFTWELTMVGANVTVHLRKLPTFEMAAAERNGMYDSGNTRGPPDKKALANDKCVSGWIGDKAHATALVGRNIIDCESSASDPRSLLRLLENILDFPKEGPKFPMKVGNASANGVNGKGQKDLRACYKISTASYLPGPHYIVQVSTNLLSATEASAAIYSIARLTSSRSQIVSTSTGVTQLE